MLAQHQNNIEVVFAGLPPMNYCFIEWATPNEQKNIW